MKNIYALCILIVAVLVLGIASGYQLANQQILIRASHLPDDIDCFTNRHIEHILYNEPFK